MGLYDERDELSAGRRLGRYEIVASIGEGGMGRVWAARMEGTRGFKKVVAIKTLSAAVAADPEAERMLLNEAQLASQIHHRHVVEVLDLGEDAGVLYIVMEWVDGESLQRLLRGSGRAEPFPFDVAARIAADAASGLHAAHELVDESGRHLAIVHRDVSPQNILVARDGTVKVVDFGIAKALGLGGQATRTGELKGKISYMSPEQVTGGSVDWRGDIFALGVVLFEMITARRPFVAAHEVQVLQLIADGVAPRPSTVVQGVPFELEQIVMTALARDPAHRYPTAEAFSLALEQFLSRAGRVVTGAHLAAVVRERCGTRIDAARKKITSSVSGTFRAPPPPASTTAPASEVPLYTPNATANISNVATPAISAEPAQRAPRSGFVPWAVAGVATLVAASTLLLIRTRAHGDAAAGGTGGARSPAIALHVAPAGARVTVGGALAGAGDQQIARPATGVRTRVVVAADGYATSTLDIASDAPDDVRVALVAVTASSNSAGVGDGAPSASFSIPEVHVDAPIPSEPRRGRTTPAAPRTPEPAVTVPKNPY